MASYCRVTILGHLASAPELRYLQGGETAVCEVAVAVNERYKKGDEVKETVSFVPVVFWRRTAQIVNEHLDKGSPILVEGRFRQDTWEKDGQKRSILKVVCDQMRMIGGKCADDQIASNEDEQLVGATTDSAEVAF